MTYLESRPRITTAYAWVESRLRAGRMGRAAARRLVAGARALGANIGPLKGGALTQWGARAPTRGPAPAPHSFSLTSVALRRKGEDLGFRASPPQREWGLGHHCLDRSMTAPSA